MADLTIEELSRQLAIQSKALKSLKAEAKSSATEVRLLKQTNESLKQRAAASHRPVAMWLNQGRDGKPDYYRIIFTDISSEMLFSLLKQGDFPEQFIDDAKRHLADLLPIPAKISCTVFPNDFKREGVESDPDYHGRIFNSDKSKQS